MQGAILVFFLCGKMEIWLPLRQWLGLVEWLLYGSFIIGFQTIGSQTIDPANYLVNKRFFLILYKAMSRQNAQIFQGFFLSFL
jgi:hypothetical protein